MNTILKNRILPISSKNQITIPKQFCTELNLSNEVLAYVENGRLVIEPATVCGAYFSEQILSDLIDQGFSGEDLKAKFKETNNKINRALVNFSAVADSAMKNVSDLPTTKDVFGE